MPPKGWRKHKWEPTPCPNCGHDPREHLQGMCSRCQCANWVILGPRNDWSVPAGWYKWPTRLDA